MKKAYVALFGVLTARQSFLNIVYLLAASARAEYRIEIMIHSGAGNVSVTTR